MQKIVPFLWFDSQAEEAAQYYVALFREGRILKIVRFGDAGPGPKGAVMTVSFELYGQQFTALNGGPQFPFTEAISLVVNCPTQEEIDRLWSTLARDGGRPGACGWIKDRYGVSWQIVPPLLPELIADPDAVKSQRTLRAMMKMGKLEIATLKRAYDGLA
ncbi:MAG TPA: VOC family protein [Steroidobacteraceae bacterium]|jgi:predicted 3-demethylubiquinone-9 3-methyltransferase (glyoxalase superfamily)|nr:VOC family protein [Steroidobacteraceae bacterium]